MGIRNVRVAAAMLCIAMVVAFLWAAGVLARWDALAGDAAMRANRLWALQPVPEEVVVVGIDEAFLDTVEEPLALSHRYLARFLALMARARPAAVGLDLVLPEKRFDTLAPVAEPGTDFHRTLVAGLLQAVQQYPLVVAKAWDADRGHYRDLQTDYVAILEMQQGGFAPQGSVLLCPDADGVIRRYPGADCQPDGSDATFASELAAAAGRRAHGAGLINFRVGGEFSYVPLQEAFRLEAAGNGGRLTQLFAGKIVLLGAILDETDLVVLPVPLAEWRPGNRQVPGVLAHAQMLRNLLTGTFVRPLPDAVQYGLLLLAGLLVAWPARLRTSTIALAVVLVALAGATLLLLRVGTGLSPAGPALVACLVWLVRAGVETAGMRRHRSLVREAFSGHVDDSTLQALIGKAQAQPAPVERQIAFLECEIAIAVPGAAASSADLLAQAGAAILDDIALAVHRHGGTIDTIGGTRVSAFFGALAVLPCPGKNALEAAADIIAAANQRRTPDAAAKPSVRVAVHAANAIAAMLPARGRGHYTVLGDGFRSTSRLLATDHPAPVLCSDEIAQALGRPPFLRDIGNGSHGWHPCPDAAPEPCSEEATP